MFMAFLEERISIRVWIFFREMARLVVLFHAVIASGWFNNNHQLFTIHFETSQTHSCVALIMYLGVGRYQRCPERWPWNTRIATKCPLSYSLGCTTLH
ncbi:hypothetical protein BDV34DRAFT_118037 [Aspergillus parasiticus]|uniref:Uncharacterized protein n=1 Tax=Aspergillus parasiticus TaxID=5067 RepID=A0A5N6DHH4_ASPPA|nr:hypothetical protein BDV34DRAFT_118037 [Aspergillus parasiticus]